MDKGTKFVTCIRNFGKIGLYIYMILLLNFVAFLGVASLFVRGVENRKSEVDNEKALELTNSTVFHRGRQQKSSRADK